MEGFRNKLSIAICSALTAGTLGSAAALAQQPPAAAGSTATTSAPSTQTPTTGTTTTSSTSAATTAPGTPSSAGTSTTSRAPGAPGYSQTPQTSSGDDSRTGTPSQPPMNSSGTTSTDYDQSRTSTTRSGSNMQGRSANEVIWFVMPVALQSQGDSLSNGCWVRLYSGDNFEGRAISIVGPAQIPELRSPYGTGLNNWESAVVGSNAIVTTYDDQEFRARNATLRAGQRYPDLNDSKLGLFEDIESIKVACNDSGNRSGQGMSQ